MKTAAVKIQSFFRMIRINKFLEIHRNDHKHHERIKNILQNILTILDEEIMCNLIREFIHVNREFRGQYSCASDFDKVLQIRQIKGASISSNQWRPIIRQNLKVSGDEIVHTVVDLFIDLPVYILKVFDNDSEREIQRFVHNVMPFHYRRNEKGFTVLGYGWGDDNKNEELKWTLHLTTIKGSPQFVLSDDSSLSLEIPNPRIYELSNIYIPNSQHYIAQLILRVSEDCNVSMKFQASYQNANIKLQVLNESSVLREIIGKSAVLVPIIDLTKEIEYSINVYILEDSWPLTKDEWIMVKKSKKNFEDSIPVENSQEVSTESFTRDTNQREKSLTNSLEGPRWNFQVLLDTKVDAKLNEDTKRALEILKIKRLWQSEDPNRLERGEKIREEFYRQNCITHYDTESLEYDNVFSKTTLSSSAGINEEMRCLHPPQDYDNIPLLDFTSIANEFTIKTSLQEEMERKIEKENLLKFQKKLKHSMQHLEMVIISSLRVSTY